MNRSRAISSFIWNLICALAAVLAELAADPSLLGLFPAKYAHVITMASLAVMWIRSHRNLFFNPDGSPAWQPWSPPCLQNPTDPSIKPKP